jgi:hypothetical protein
MLLCKHKKEIIMNTVLHPGPILTGRSNSTDTIPQPKTSESKRGAFIFDKMQAQNKGFMMEEQQQHT